MRHFFFGARTWLGTILGRISINYFSGLGLRIRVWVRVGFGLGLVLGLGLVHRCTGQHPFGGGQTEFYPNGFGGWGGGGGSSRKFPGSVFCGVLQFFPLTPLTDPKLVFFSR